MLADVEVELFGAEEVKSWSGTVFLSLVTFFIRGHTE